MNFLKRLITRRMQRAGYSSHFAYKIFERRFNDLFKNDKTTFKKKLWAQKRGFYSNRIDYYGLTEENYQDYLNDFDYYRLHPINKDFSHWIDDKLTYKLILHPFSEYLPKYYFHLVNGEILKLMDCPGGYESNITSIINLLVHEGALAAKPLSGSYGEGFTKLGYSQDYFRINDDAFTPQEMYKKIETWINTPNNGYLITEYVKPHPKLAEINPKTPNTIRVSVVREKNQPAVIVGAHIGFGLKESGYADNLGPGGKCRINLKVGTFEDGKIKIDGVPEPCKFHPDTKKTLHGSIPHWHLIMETILKISNYLPQLICMGFDIASTTDGFKILEINSHEGNTYNQSISPYRKNEKTKDFYISLIREKEEQINYQKDQRLLRRILRRLTRLFYNPS